MAAKAFQKSVELEPNNGPAYANLGFLAAERGSPEEAERLLRRSLALDAESYPATYDLGRLLVRLRRYDEALPILEHGSTLNQDDPGVHYQLFIAYSRLKRKPDADRELARFKQLEELRKQREGGMGTKESLPDPKAEEVRKKNPVNSTQPYE